MSSRREFITLLGGVAAAWPLVARAQQGERMRRVGVLMSVGESDPEAQTRVAMFRAALQHEAGDPRRRRRSDTKLCRTQRAGDGGVEGRDQDHTDRVRVGR